MAKLAHLEVILPIRPLLVHNVVAPEVVAPHSLNPKPRGAMLLQMQLVTVDLVGRYEYPLLVTLTAPVLGAEGRVALIEEGFGLVVKPCMGTELHGDAYFDQINCG